jgi:immune inhibitor A
MLFFMVLALAVPLSPQSVSRPLAAAPEIVPPHPAVLEKARRGLLSLPQVAHTSDSADATERGRSPVVTARATGPVRVLAVLVDFSDKIHSVNASFFDTLIFAAPKPGRGSVRDYYSEVSYGQIDLVSLNLPSSVGWWRAAQKYSYYAGSNNCIAATYPNNCQKLAEDVVDALSGVVDFSNYDNDYDGVAEPIMIIHAGSGAEYTGSASDMWSHSWGLRTARRYNNVTISKYLLMPEYWYGASANSSDMTIGVFAHELAHGLWNLRDLYDRDYTSYGVGMWSLMAGGAWNGPGFDGSSPAWPDAWSRMLMGVVTPTLVLTNTFDQAIPQAYGSSADGTVYQLRSAALGAREYYVVENRQRVSGSYDEYLPGPGLLVWHVDEAMDTNALLNNYECKQGACCSCDPQKHYLVALEQADGALQLEKYLNQGDGTDPFPSGGQHTFSALTSSDPHPNSWYSCANTCISVSNISAPAATMTADLRITCPSLTPRVFLPLALIVDQ